MHDSLYFSDQHLQVRDMVRDFARSVVKPSARGYDLESKFPWDNVKQMADLGLFGIPWPEALGGSGMDYLSYILVIHEMAKVDASHRHHHQPPIRRSARRRSSTSHAEQKKEIRAAACDRQSPGRLRLTEPGAGSDAGAPRRWPSTRRPLPLERLQDLHHHAGVGEVFVVTARAPIPRRQTNGITAFIVTKDTCDVAEAQRVGVGHDTALVKMAGVKRGRRKTSSAGARRTRASWCSRMRVSPRKTSWVPRTTASGSSCITLDGGRIGIGALALGIAEGALEECLTYTASRKQFGRAIASFQGVHFALADMATEIEAPNTSSITAAGSNSTASRSSARPRWRSCNASDVGDASHDQSGAAARRVRLHHRVPPWSG